MPAETLPDDCLPLLRGARPWIALVVIWALFFAVLLNLC